MFGYGLILVCFQNWIRKRKQKLGYFDSTYEQRKEIRDFGIQLITISAVMMSLLYSGWNYRLSSDAFELEHRPFLKLEPKSYKADKFVQDVTYESESDYEFKVQYKISNIGNIPASNVKISKAVGHREIQKRFEEIKEFKDSKLTIFPSDVLTLNIPFKATYLSAPAKTLFDDGVVVEIRIDYGGFSKQLGQPYFSLYRLKYHLSGEPIIEWIEADLNP